MDGLPVLLGLFVFHVNNVCVLSLQIFIAKNSIAPSHIINQVFEYADNRRTYDASTSPNIKGQRLAGDYRHQALVVVVGVTHTQGSEARARGLHSYLRPTSPAGCNSFKVSFV